MQSDESHSASPATLVWAVRLLFVEAAGLVALTAYLIVLDLTVDSGSVPVAIALTVWFWPRPTETSAHLAREQPP